MPTESSTRFVYAGTQLTVRSEAVRRENHGQN